MMIVLSSEPVAAHRPSADVASGVRITPSWPTLLAGYYSVSLTTVLVGE